MSYQSPYRKFIFHGFSWNANERKLTFTYSFDRSLFFQEDVTFISKIQEKNYDREIFHNACELAHILSGISYYKAYPTPEIELDNIELTQKQANFFTKTYKKGLGEYLFENELVPDVLAEFPASRKDEKVPPQTGNENGRLLLIGGGKDSLVSADVLKKNDMPFTQFRVNPVKWVRMQMNSLNADQILLNRQISRNLFELNEKDALNGHVPITGIIMSLALIAGILAGKRDVILSNESSANEPNVSYKGMDVNHQYSKSFEFEKDIQEYVRSYISQDMRLFSLLRPLSELAITEHFAKELWDDYKHSFSSSNSNFKHGKNTSLDWDSTSPKTASVFSMLSAFLELKELLSVFDENLYEKKELKATWRQLFGQENHKPFECVATVSEMQQAALMAQKQGWGDVASRFSIPLKVEGDDFRMRRPHELPSEYEKALEIIGT